MLRRSLFLRRTSFTLNPEMAKSLTRLIYHEHHRPRTAEEDEHIAAATHLDPAQKKFFQKPQFRDPDRQKRALADSAGAAGASRITGGGNTYNVAEGVFESKMELRWITDHVNDLDVESQKDFEQYVQRAVLARVDERRPLAYVLGSQPFLGCDIICKEPLLIPRTETEEWCTWLTQQYLHPVEDYNYPNAIGAHQRRVRPYRGTDEDQLAEVNYHQRLPGQPLAKMRVLDLCCGTGCIGASLLRQFDWIEVVGVDSDQRACEVAFENYYNAARLGVRHRVQRAEQDAEEARLRERRERAALLEEEGDGEKKKKKDDFFDDEDLEDEEEITSALPKEERIMNRIRRKAEELEAKVDKEHEEKNRGRISVLQSDMFRDLPDHIMKRSDGRGSGFDLILCNPPYLMPEEWEMTEPSVKNFESRTALVGDARHEQQPLSYFKELCEESPKWLCAKPPSAYRGPRLMFEIGIQAKYIQQMFDQSKRWKKTLVHCDRFEQPRWVETGF